jgi:hypothetical protein
MLLILLILVLVFGFGGYTYGPRLGYTTNPYYGGGFGIGGVLLVILVLFLLHII